jgi:hypothetical protein
VAIAEVPVVINFLKNKDSAGGTVAPARKPVPVRPPRKWTPQQHRKYMATSGSMEYLRPEQCAWISSSTGCASGSKYARTLRSTATRRVIHELQVILDLLVRARAYIVNVSSKRDPG